LSAPWLAHLDYLDEAIETVSTEVELRISVIVITQIARS